MRITPLLNLFVAGSIAACSNSPTLRVQSVNETEIIMTSSGANVSTMRTLNGAETLCLRLGPDAASDVSSDVNLVSFNNKGGDDAASDNEVEMVGRTPTNILIRDSLFHLCTLRQSELITQEQYLALMHEVFDRGFSLSEQEILNSKIDISVASAGLPDNHPAPPAIPTPVPPTATNPFRPPAGNQGSASGAGSTWEPIVTTQ